ncbi:class I SAM-dependent methyltransferase [Novosphingopyxis sp. YJ-S2-01]|uniref:class I SAM-dependent methyltransferase n=1 Tax=Novosphingopyxis sp. YJ-S2-01 TaxID=2794021 RepID=UPI0018DD48EF|nr:class I SAM-dependent methyltransferase [Novosphingopyxis sp. YJ-S2-01]MBH9538439.1 class I SAM-dependent methyltransferase [Novosphingopyxis sp. YJ-S2-01]
MYSFERRDSCPSCASELQDVLARTKFKSDQLWPVVALQCNAPEGSLGEQDYEAVQCPVCSTIYQSWVGNEELLADLYGEWISDELTDREKVRFAWLTDNPKLSRDAHDLMTAAAILKTPLSELKTLDYGMGLGLWAEISGKLGCASYGFDYSKSRTELAAMKGIRTTTLAEIDGANFDFINLEQVMEHVTDTDTTMTLIQSGLRPGGLLRISVPGQNALRSALKKLGSGTSPSASEIDPLSPLQHVNAFTSKGLRELGRRFGVIPISQFYAQRFAFLLKGGISVRYPIDGAKELLRPLLPLENRRNLTVWFRKPFRARKNPRSRCNTLSPHEERTL